jgi:hypothetical protein
MDIQNCAFIIYWECWSRFRAEQHPMQNSGGRGRFVQSRVNHDREISWLGPPSDPLSVPHATAAGVPGSRACTTGTARTRNARFRALVIFPRRSSSNIF